VPDGAALGADAGSPPAVASPTASHAVVVPADPNAIITRKGQQSNADYGLIYVLFTACAGHLEPRPQATANDLPLHCVDSAGTELSSDDFVPGYTALYVYANRRNQNPVIKDFVLAQRRVPVCPKGDCPLDIRVDVDRDKSPEIDEGAVGAHGEQLHEQLWVDFYATRGDFEHDVRLINDATLGWNDDNGTQFKIPADPGPVHLWAVVHDNRGGVAWTEADIDVVEGTD
jgi:hypothetical protein